MCALKGEVGVWLRHEHGKSKNWRKWQMLDHRWSRTEGQELLRLDPEANRDHEKVLNTIIFA